MPLNKETKSNNRIKFKNKQQMKKEIIFRLKFYTFHIVLNFEQFSLYDLKFLTDETVD